MTEAARRRRLGLEAAILAAATGLAAAMLVARLLNSRTEALDEEQRRVDHLAAALALHVESEITAIDRALSDLADTVRDAPGLLQGRDGRLATQTRSLARISMQRATFGVIDADGRLVAASGTDTARRIDLAGRAFFAFHRQSRVRDEPMIFGPQDSIAGGEAAFLLTRAIRDERGAFLGVAGAAVPLAGLARDYETFIADAGVRFGVVHRDGFALSAGLGGSGTIAREILALAEGPARRPSPLTGRDRLSTRTALARLPVALQGGRVDVVSRPGHGSTFSVRLPTRQSAGAVSSQAAE